MIKSFIAVCLVLITGSSWAQTVVTEKRDASSFPIVSGEVATSLLLDEKDDSLVSVAANLFADDVERVTGKRPGIGMQLLGSKHLIVIGTLKSGFIQDLLGRKKISADRFKDKWDGYLIQIVKAPYPGVDQAMVIAGGNKRGAAYGILELSRQMGVSPWYWWADVPVKKKQEVYVKGNTLFADAPAVKYRGIFINDEAPCFSRWTKEQFGGVNHFAYEKIFELLLRLKGNYLWPAMWSNAFNDDDKMNPVLADKWGIVMGTSHHEPMVRSQKEWQRYGKGAWDYTVNAKELGSFWQKGIENMGSHESIATIGMRGDGDKPMTQGTATELLEKIVADQRKIIEDVTHRPAAETPQLWALYKEVQEYYDKGMRVPDDVTLLLCDDNYGNIRKLPRPTDKPRAGGYGIYYHFDYVGDPRNYKWINTNNIARVWEQMHLAYEHGVDKIWVVNVGDIKPMEFPISFFLDYAWNRTKWNETNLPTYYQEWAADQFGSAYAKETADIMRLYALYTARRKPELVDAGTYSIQNYDEGITVLKEFRDLVARAEKINSALPESYRDAFFQVVLHPLKANTILHELYYAVAMNRYYATQNNILANGFADKAKEFYMQDSLLSIQYNKTMANGKWNHMMDQVHIGYRTWNDPPVNKMPDVTYVSQDTKPTNTTPVARVVTSAEKLVPKAATGYVFFELDGVVSIGADHFSRAVNSNGIKWTVIPDIGRTGAALTPFPVTAGKQQPGKNSPHVEYDFYTSDSNAVSLKAYLSPTLNFFNDSTGLQYAVSIDNEVPQVVTTNVYKDPNIWRGWTASNIIIKATDHGKLKPGKHTLHYWMVQPGVVLQKLVLNMGGEKQSYLGPPETIVRR